jgi:hypothetical protein
MGQPMPDTLSVNFNEQGDLALVINRFLEMGDRVQVRKITISVVVQYARHSNPYCFADSRCSRFALALHSLCIRFAFALQWLCARFTLALH